MLNEIEFNKLFDRIIKEDVENKLEIWPGRTVRIIAKVINKPGFVAYRMMSDSGKKMVGWIVLYDNEPIGFIYKSDSKWVHDNFTSRPIFKGEKPLHRLITKETRMVVESELKKMARKVQKAYHEQNADIVY
jgi:hypothetical protein